MTTFILPCDIPSQNKRERWHWSKQRAEVKRWATLFRDGSQGLRPPTGKRHVSITSYRRQRCRDMANLVGGCKGLIDGLVRAGVLLDDSIALMEATYAQEVVSRSPTGKPCTVVAISEWPLISDDDTGHDGQE